MNTGSAALFRALLRAARPWSLAAGVLLYTLGGGIATYLGYLIDWPVYWIGQAAVTLLQLSSYFLQEYFDRVDQPPFQARPFKTPPYQAPPPLPPRPAEENQPEPVEIEPPRVIFLQAAAATLTIGAVMSVLLYAEGKFSPVVLLFIGLTFLLAILYAVPPFRLADSGYGELVTAIMTANLFPALAFLLQAGELHRLLAMLTFPLTLLYLASSLAVSLRQYAEDVRRERKTLLTRLGWQRGMSLHNLLIGLAYITLALAAIAGLPWQLVFPPLLALPFGMFQIWQMSAIAAGAKPRWRLLFYMALAVVGVTAYFMNLALWTG
jgi:1,4-dihydroxy-2-naphthoate octaprenyltransferase